MSSLYTERFKNTSNYALEVTVFMQFFDDANTALSHIKVSKDNIKDATNALLIYKAEIKTLILDFVNLSNAISNMFDQFIVVGETQDDTFKFFTEISQLVYDLRSVEQGIYRDLETASRDELIVNIKVFQQIIAVNVMTRMLPVALAIDYQQATGISANIELISKQYDFVLSQNIFVDGYIQVILIKDQTILVDQFSQTISALKQKQFSLPLEQDVNVQRTSLLPLIYQYYSSIEKIDNIVSLNKEQSPFNITDNFRILTNV
jgi:hypothetical protein